MDPSKAEKPRDPLAAETATTIDLLLAAKARMTTRKDLPTNRCWQIDLLNLHNAVMMLMCCCRRSRFGNAMRQGVNKVKHELDLFHFLKK
jgi:hypothetical protein